MRTAFLVSAVVALASCSDATSPRAVSVTVSESRVQPTVELIGGADYTVFRNHTSVDVEFTNGSAESVWLDGCLPLDTAPVMILERDDGRPSALQGRRVCTSAPSFEVPAQSSVGFVFTLTSDFFCSRYSSDCVMAESRTWGYHRLAVPTERGTVYSNPFAITSPLVFDF